MKYEIGMRLVAKYTFGFTSIGIYSKPIFAIISDIQPYKVKLKFDNGTETILAKKIVGHFYSIVSPVIGELYD